MNERLIPIFPLGWYWIIPAFLITMLLGLGAAGSASPTLTALTGLAAVLTFLIVWFFRDPQRTADPDALARLGGLAPIVAPAEGKIADITTQQGKTKIGIFLSPIDVHVQWVPLEGRVTGIERKGTQFLAAYNPRASDFNVSSSIYIDHPKLGRCVVRQITGFLVRRILTQTHQGASLKFGSRLGMILLGSRVELEIPEEVRLLIKMGDRVKAGKSIIGCYAP